jgi:thioredoxin 1
MAEENVINVTSENFEQEVLKSEQTVLVDFWAGWCGPCRMVGPIIEELAQDYSGKLKVGKLNVDEQGELSAKFKVMSIPTIIVFKNGEVVDKAIGARSKAEFENMISKHI